MQQPVITPTQNGFGVNGPVGFSNVVCLRLAGEKLLAAHFSHDVFVIDLSEMKDQDASSFSLLLCWIRFAKKNKLTLSFLNQSNSMQRMQKMLGLSASNIF